MDISTVKGMVLCQQAHVVDWQLTSDAGGGQYESSSQQLRERIKALEARAMSLLYPAVTIPGAVAAQRSLAALEAEIARLRADLAWLRAEERAA
jgi:hypothetical protein